MLKSNKNDVDERIRQKKNIRGIQSIGREILFLNLADKLKQFWAEESSGMITQFDRNKLISYSLLIFHEFVIMNYNFNTYTSDRIVTKNASSSGYLRFIIIEKWPESFILAFYLFATTINFILCFYILAKLACYIIFNISIRNHPFISLLFKVYNYIVFQAAIYCNIYYYDQSPLIAAFTFATSIFIMILTAYLDYDIRFHTKDFLARRESRQDAWIGFLQAFACFEVRAGKWSFSLSWFAAGYSFIMICWNYYRHPYSNTNTQSFRFGLCVCNLMLSLSLIFLLIMDSPHVDFILLLLINVPVSIFAGYSILALKQKGLISRCFLTESAASTLAFDALTAPATKPESDSNLLRNLRELDIFFRLLYSSVDCSLKQYLSSDVSIVLEQLITDHNLTCKKFPLCFCNKKNENKGDDNKDSAKDIVSKEDFVGESARKQYLEEYILRRFEIELKNPKAHFTPFHFSYFAFLTNALRSEFTSLREIMKLKESVYVKSDAITQSKINLLFQIASQEFELHAKQIQLQSQIKIIDILDYDVSLTEAYSSYSELLRMKLVFLDLIKMDQLNIQQLQNYAKILYVKREALKLRLVDLYSKNSSSPFLIAICGGFKDCLTIENPFSKHRKGQAQKVNTAVKSSLYRKKSKNNIPLYSETSATVFLSLLSHVGRIKKVSRNFHKVTDFCNNASDLIGKNISAIMSEEVAAVHDQILLYNLSKKDVNYSVRDFPILIAKDFQGWSYPISVKTQITLIGINELGACATFQPIRDGNSYILASDTSHELQVQIMSRHVFEILFSQKQRLKNHKSIDQSNIRKIRLSRIAPLITDIIESEQSYGLGSLYETIIIQPTSLEDALIKHNILSPDFLKSLLQANLFSIKFSVFPVYNDIIRIVQIQVVSIQPLRQPALKKEALHNYMVQLSQFHDITQLKSTFNYIFNQLSNQEQQSFLFEQTLLPSDTIRSPLIGQDGTTLIVQSTDYVQEGTNLLINQNSNSNTNIDQTTTIIGRNSNQQLNQQQQQQFLPQPKSAFSSTSIQVNKGVEHLNQLVLQGEQSVLSRISIPGASNLALVALPDMNGQNSERTIESHRNNQILSNQNQEYYQQQRNRMKQQVGVSNITNFTPRSVTIDQQNPDTNRMMQLLSPTSRYQQNFLEEQIILTPHAAAEDEGIFLNENRYTQVNRDTNRWKLGITQNDGEEEQKYNQQDKQLSHIDENDNNQQQAKKKKEINKQDQKVKTTFHENKDAEDQGSVNSSATNNQSAKKQRILKVIRSNRLPQGLRIIHIVGILSIVLIAVANIASFFILHSDQKSQQLNFENFYWCFQMKRYISLVLGIHKAYISTLYNQYSFDSVTAQLTFARILAYNKLYIHQGYKNLTMQLVNTNHEDVFIFDQAWNYPIDVVLPNSLNFSETLSFESTLTQKIMYWYNFAYYMLLNDDSQWVYSSTAFMNYKNMLDGLNVINERNLVNVNSNIQASQNLIQIMLIAIVSLTSLFSFLVIPIYAFNQKKREEILKLFATIPAVRIQNMLNSVQEHQAHVECLERVRLKQEVVEASVVAVKEKQRVKNIRENTKAGNKNAQLQVKRKNISSTTSLIRFDLKFIPFLLLFLMLTLVNPIATFLIYSRQFSNFQAGITLLNSMETFFENICSLLSMKYELTFVKLSFPTNSVIKPFLEQANEQRGKSQSLLTDLINQETIYEENDQIYDREQYQNFLFPLFKGNICETLEQSNRDFREVVVSPARCKVLFEGKFTKGIIAISKATITYVDGFYDAASANDLAYFKSVLLSMQQRINIREEFETFQIILFLTKIIQYFFRDLYSEYYAFIFTLSTIFLCLQLVLLAAVLIFGWRKFYVFICSELFTTKQLIDLIDIETLLDNSYVTSYFLKNNFVKN